MFSSPIKHGVEWLYEQTHRHTHFERHKSQSLSIARVVGILARQLSCLTTYITGSIIKGFPPPAGPYNDIYVALATGCIGACAKLILSEDPLTLYVSVVVKICAINVYKQRWRSVDMVEVQKCVLHRTSIFYTTSIRVYMCTSHTQHTRVPA